jgi:hypothetical protein
MWRLAEETDNDGDSTAYTYGSTDWEATNAPATWEYDMITGCHCDRKDNSQPRAGPNGVVHGFTLENEQLPGFQGYDCSQRWCATGDDPDKGTAGVDEVQTVACTASTGTFTLTFRQDTTGSIAYNAAASVVDTALEALTTIDTVTVTLSTGSVACDASSGVLIQVTFTSEQGNVPALTNSGGYTVAATTTGTKDNAECSSRGVCDRSTGACMCYGGYSSSDGAGNVGTRGDCSYKQGFIAEYYESA